MLSTIVGICLGFVFAILVICFALYWVSLGLGALDTLTTRPQAVLEDTQLRAMEENDEIDEMAGVPIDLLEEPNS